MANLVFPLPAHPQINQRSAPTIPGINAPEYYANVIHTIPAGQTGSCTNVVAGQDGHWWLNVGFDQADGTQFIGWVRDDVVMVGGDFTRYGQGAWLNAFVRPDISWPKPPGAAPAPAPVTPAQPTPATPAPAPNSGLLVPPVTGYKIWQDFGGNHEGVDCGSLPIGTPIINTWPGFGYWYACAECGNDHNQSGTSQGLPLSSTAILINPGWNYGFGNMVILRYTIDALPTQASKNLRGATLNGKPITQKYVYVLLAHMNEFRNLPVPKQGAVDVGQAVGTLGQSGNTNGAHLHLQVIISDSPTPPTTYNQNVVDPHLLYAL